LDNNENKKDNAVRELEATLKKQRIGGVKVTAINKSVYSIYRHLEEDKKDNKERSFALRVILETPELSEKEKVSKLEKI
jgi:(p)ppGpp synthase/HD superfamily hydrolase